MRYGGAARNVLEGVSLAVHARARVALFGANGAGAALRCALDVHDATKQLQPLAMLRGAEGCVEVSSSAGVTNPHERGHVPL